MHVWNPVADASQLQLDIVTPGSRTGARLHFIVAESAGT